MKNLILVIVFIVAAYFAIQKFRTPPVPLPPPPPPPPAILLEPAPVINEEETAKVIKSANDIDPAVRWEALALLDKMKSPKAAAIIFEKLRKDLDLELRIKILRLLSERKGPEVSQNLVWALRDHEPEVRLAALQALEKVGDYATASAITEVLKDPEERVRVQALRTLNSLQEKKAAEIAEAQRRYQEELARQAQEAAKRKAK